MQSLCIHVLQLPLYESSLVIAAVGITTNLVDLYNSETGGWSTAQLSVSRFDISATSAGNVAIFAGGQVSGSLICSASFFLHHLSPSHMS